MKKIALLSPLFMTVGCRPGEGRMWSDGIQILLAQGGWEQWLFCIFLVMVVMQAGKIIRQTLRGGWWLLKQARKLLVIRLNGLAIATYIFLGTLLWAFSEPVGDWLQEWEQSLSPVYLGQFADMNEAHQTAIFETELAKGVDGYEYAVITRRTREIAQKIQSTPLAIYQCAWVECSLRPFTVRKDQVAAGWIQFTRAGVSGLRYQGRAVQFEEVLSACRRRDIDFIMDLTELYLVDKYERADKKPLHNVIDVYLSLFAPALIGAPAQKVVYYGYDNPSYYLNKGLDGWYMVKTAGDNRQILRKNGQCDGRITVWEMYLALEAKKGRLMNQYLK